MNDATLPSRAAEAPARPTTSDRIAALALWLPVTVLSVTATLWFDRLPDELPVRLLGFEADFLSRTVILVGITGTVTLLVAVAGAISLAQVTAGIREWMVLLAGMVGGYSVAVWLIAASLALRGTAATVEDPWLMVLTYLAASYGVIPFLLSSGHRDSSPLRPADGMPLGPGEAGAWFTTVHVPSFAVLACAAILVAVAGMLLIPREVPGVPAAGVALLLVAAVCLVLSRLRVSVDRRGLRVVSSLFRFPIVDIGLDRITSARAADLSEWGGRGYRIFPGRTAIITSRGRGIVVERVGGTTFAVTVPDPDLPAALLVTLAARAAPGSRDRADS